MIDIDAIKARLAAVHTAGVHDITMRLADGRLCVFVRRRDWNCNTAHEADEAVTTLLGHAPADLTALIAEVELLRTGRDVSRAYADRLEAEALVLRGERAAVLAYLRAAYSPNTIVPLPDFLAALLRMVEKGEHHREGAE